jgi:hypothetical protein
VYGYVDLKCLASYMVPITISTIDERLHITDCHSTYNVKEDKAGNALQRNNASIRLICIIMRLRNEVISMLIVKRECFNQATKPVHVWPHLANSNCSCILKF